ncbi:hypothetical protein LCGC14_2976530 [marine sediment metagenome]|uniref:Uncharacterized protein n=1 Tax=marine sediment metagenome TaxID=412755 RepID=A0A0F8XV94_9ZZZZ
MNETFRIFLISIFAISIALFYTFTPIGAEEDVLVIEILDEDAYWTPERLRNAQPLPLPTVDGEAIERLRYVNLTAYDFRKVYKMFYEGFHIRKGLTKECFIYADPPYPAKEKYYNSGFGMDEHLELIDILLESPFNILLSIGCDCEFYIDALKEGGWFIEEVYTKYSTDANSQKETKEYFCMNYDIKKEPKLIMDYQQNILEYIQII